MAREPFNRIWTETPTVDDFGEPTNVMWDQGWRGGPDQDPPEAYAQNWWQNRVDVALRQLERDGAMEWLDSVTYKMWAFARGSDGVVYLAIQENSGEDPVSDGGANWLSIPGYINSQLNASGGAPLFAVRAWCNLNGTSYDSSGNVAIRASGNISGISRISEGNYRVSFSSSLQDSNYSVSFNVSQLNSGPGNLPDHANAFNFTPSGFDFRTTNNTANPESFIGEAQIVTFMVVR